MEEIFVDIFMGLRVGESVVEQRFCLDRGVPDAGTCSPARAALGPRCGLRRVRRPRRLLFTNLSLCFSWSKDTIRMGARRQSGCRLKPPSSSSPCAGPTVGSRSGPPLLRCSPPTTHR